MKLDYSNCTEYDSKCIAKPASFVISSNNDLNNHIKLDLVVNEKSFRGFNIAADILGHRHLK